MVDNSNEVKILNNVVRYRDAMLGTMGSQPGNVDVLLWRGHGFGRNPPLSTPDIVNNLPWGHFHFVEDLMAWRGEQQGTYSLPYQDSSRVIFNPGTGTATFLRNN
jgi:hypothetical protein